MQKKIWFNVHWLLGLIAGTILMVVGFSGALLSFEKEILEMINKESLRVEISQKTRLSPEALLEEFSKRVPQGTPASMTLYADPQASAYISVPGEGGGKNVKNYYIDPYSGELLPELQGREFFKFVLDLHRRLVMGEVGKQIVGASTVALIILSLSGIYLYWGSIRKSLKSSLSIRFKTKGRGFLYQLHSALGLWGVVVFLLISLTGLTWSYEWYRSYAYAIAGVEMPKKGAPQGGKGQQGKPASKDGSKEERQRAYSFADVKKAWDVFEGSLKKPYEYATLRFPSSGSMYEFTYFDENAPHSRARNTLQLDLKKETVVSHARYDEKRLNEQIMSSMLPLHSGEYFGIVGRLLVFLASGGMLLFGITGIMLYLDRLKKARKKALLHVKNSEGLGAN